MGNRGQRKGLKGEGVFLPQRGEEKGERGGWGGKG